VTVSANPPLSAENEPLFDQTGDGRTPLDVRFAREAVWPCRQAVVADFATTGLDGSTYQVRSLTCTDELQALSSKPLVEAS